MARDDHQIRVRLPVALLARMEAEAQRNRRSLNAEIVSRLEHSTESGVELSRLSEEMLHRITTQLRQGGNRVYISLRINPLEDTDDASDPASEPPQTKGLTTEPSDLDDEIPF